VSDAYDASAGSAVDEPRAINLPLLAGLRPDLVERWAEDLNGHAADEQPVPPVGDPTRAWWRCERDPSHEFEGAIAYRARHPWRCKHCPHPPEPGTSLRDTHPGLAREWDADANLPFTPADLRAGSNREVVWRCPEHPDLHVYTRPVSRRALQGVGCVYCSGFASDQLLNSVTAVAPHLVWEWDYQRNDSFPEDVVARSGKKAWWRCAAGHSWQAVIATRTMKGVGCAKCTARHTSITEALLRAELRRFLPNVLLEGRRIDASSIGVTKRTMWPEVDIVLPDLKIAVEYDGSYYHRHRLEQDRRKTEMLRRLGWTVIRVRTGDLPLITEVDIKSPEPIHHLDSVVPAIVAQVLRRIEQVTNSQIVGLDKYEERGTFIDLAAAEQLVRAMPRPRSRRIVLEAPPTLPPKDDWSSADFAAVVRATRLTHGHTIAEASIATGVGALQLRKYEAGTARPRLGRTMDALRTYLRLDVATFERLLGRPQPGATGRERQSRSTPPDPPDPSDWATIGLGATLRGLRLARQQTQAEVAAAVGVTFGALSVWELGSATPRDRTVIAALERHFGVEPGSLVSLVAPPKRHLGLRDGDPQSERLGMLATNCTCQDPAPGDLGHIIEHLRLQRTLAQAELATALETVQGTVSRWERGAAEPLLDSLVRLSEFLDVPLVRLLAAHPIYGHASTFGGLVLAARAARRLNQQDLAELLGVGQATISKWERGEAHPWPKQFETVAAALGVPVDTVRAAVPYRRPGTAGTR